MAERGPVWLASLDASTGGVDFMGLRQPGLVMADRLFPGITNTTRQVRTYSMIGWLFANGVRPSGMRVLESAFVHATHAHDHQGRDLSGVVGSQSLDTAASVLDTGIRPKGKKKVVSALDAAFYGPSARALGVGGRDGEGALRGTRLGLALAGAVGVVPASRSAVSAGLVKELGALCPCTPAVGQERDLLEELLFRHERIRSDEAGRDDQARRRSLALVLHLLGQGARGERAVLEQMLDRLVGHAGVGVPDALDSTAEGLGIVALRWHFRHAVESAWTAFGRLIQRERPRGCRVGPYVDLALGAAREEAWHPRGDQDVLDVAMALTGRGMPMRIHESADTDRDVDPARCLLSAAVQLAVVGHLVGGLDRAGLHHSDLLDLQQPWWCPLSGLATELTPMSVRRWVTFVVDRYVIGQHFITAARKWGDGKDGFFFHPTDAGYRLDAKRFSRDATLKGWKPDPGPTKIPAALSLMRGIGLVELDEDGWRVQKRGAEALRRVVEETGAGQAHGHRG